jgi:hypothetical protein
MEIAGHVSRKMLEHYGHVRIPAKRAQSTRSEKRARAQPANSEGSAMDLVDEMGFEPHDLLIANEEKSEIRHGAAIT